MRKSANKLFSMLFLIHKLISRPYRLLILLWQIQQLPVQHNPRTYFLLIIVKIAISINKEDTILIQVYHNEKEVSQFTIFKIKVLKKLVKCSVNTAHKIVLDMEGVLEFDNKDELL